jgi:hypothetical protein
VVTPELEAFFEKVGTNWSFDPLRDPNWTPSREDYAALRDGAREALAVLRRRLAEKDEALREYGEHKAFCVLAHVCTCGLDEALRAEPAEEPTP